ncbi:DUF1624 domain-containing protein [Pseudoclavibacter chungangensis]|uniref:DUF1624 domain-containing protein n=1 Tax=Pseudoclavibacter chungangensis TaxID=587635 RepID=A0A7J5BNM3_9MICO|nr:heparan-alpha-glucosaminide N-acetyltransferase domain-containing protein [Pseudoclavibacter chungangensis]KAB1653858.1 DUF1624 domain-containing protein [Pseudoclavibacter chungangensis]NYJ68128.1 hypothetical protein [Pseudoclavibacter chungangensis]
MTIPPPVPSAPQPIRVVAPVGRVAGLDLARFLALVGMMATHLWIGFGVGEDPAFVDVISGKAAALFAVLAGVGIALTTRGDLAAGRPRAARLAVFGRGAALIAIGLTLGLVPGIILVILVYYGITFWLAIPALRWRNGVLLAVATGWALVWPVLSMLLRGDADLSLEVGSANWFDLTDPLVFVRGLFVTGAYPALTWVVYVLVGLVVGRLVIAARETGTRGAVQNLGVRLAATGTIVSASAFLVSLLALWPLGGLAAFAAEEGTSRLDLAQEELLDGSHGIPGGTSWWYLASPAPHSGSFPDLAITAGLAVAIIGVLLALGTLLGATGVRVLGPVLAAGAAPLTVYTTHVFVAGIAASLVLADWSRSLAEGHPWWFVSGWIWLCHIAGALLIGFVLMKLRVRGPLERFVGWVGRRAARLARDRLAEAPPGHPSG